MEGSNTKNRLRYFLIGGMILALGGLAFILVQEPDKENEEILPESLADAEETKSNPNLDSSIQAFLKQRSEKKGEDIKTIITENFDSVTGVYAYPFEVTKLEDTVTINLGISEVEVPKQTVISYGGFTEKVKEIEEGSVGLALITYNINQITEVELFSLKDSFTEIQNSILKADLSTKQESESEVTTKQKTYQALDADDWKGMALLTSRDIVSRDMAPIFIVPNSSLTIAKDLQDTFYYIIAGTLQSSNTEGTVLKSYEGKTIRLDFGTEVPQEYLGNPVWIHAVTQDGIIKNVEFQQFKGADLSVMAEGIIAYISTSAINAE